MDFPRLAHVHGFARWDLARGRVRSAYRNNTRDGVIEVKYASGWAPGSGNNDIIAGRTVCHCEEGFSEGEAFRIDPPREEWSDAGNLGGALVAGSRSLKHQPHSSSSGLCATGTSPGDSPRRAAEPRSTATLGNGAWRFDRSPGAGNGKERAPHRGGPVPGRAIQVIWLNSSFSETRFKLLSQISMPSLSNSQ